MASHTKVRKVLLYDIGSHATGKQAWRRAMILMDYRYGFELVISDAALGSITSTTLAGVDVVVFSQGDGDRVPSTASATALTDFIYRDGKAMLMVHAAAAFITCGGTGTGGGGSTIDAEDASCRFMARAVARQYHGHVNPGTRARIYADSVFAGQVPPHGSLGASGGIFSPAPPAAVMNHGRRNDESKNIFNNDLEFNWKLPANSPTDPSTVTWDGVGDEWYYYFNNPGPRAIPSMTRAHGGVTYIESRLNILLALDETSRDMGSYRMGDHPQSWVRKMGNGLSAYNNMGHDNTPFQARTGVAADSLAHKYTWNLIRFLSRDYVGCDSIKYAEYNPHASVTQLTNSDPVQPCVTPVSIVSRVSPTRLEGVRVWGRGIEIAIPNGGFYRIHVSDIRGRAMYAKTVVGGSGKQVRVADLTKGSYFVRVTSPMKQQKVVRVDL
jgi:hypothetical protein